MTEDLYTTNDTKRTREFLLKEQQGLDLLTGLPIPDKQACLDHKHNDECFVRGVLHRQSNACLGKIENLYVRYLSYWYPHDLQTFLRQAADYLDLPEDKRYRHNSWVKRLKVLFNKLNSKQMKQVLETFGKSDGKNLVERKKIFAEIVLDRNLGYEVIREAIEKVKDESN